jgi:hypothetical protein
MLVLFVFMTQTKNMGAIEYELPQLFVTTTPGEPFRLLRFGPLFKGGKLRELTAELLAKFKLPQSHADTTPAGGHITGLEVRDDGLYAKTEWTPLGLTAIEEGHYRYQSPEVIWEEGGLENPDTGQTIRGPLIVGAALLPNPHLGESAALYGIEPHYDGGDSMTETLTPPDSFWDRLLAQAFRSDPEPEQEPDPAPIAGIEPEKSTYRPKSPHWKPNRPKRAALPTSPQS